MTARACPVVLHPDGAPLRHLVVHHPSAGAGLVTGTPRPGEDPTRAAVRVLWNEAGVQAGSALPMGSSENIRPGEVWHFSLIRPAIVLRERWQHLSTDRDSRRAFSWLALSDRPSDMDPCDERALDWIAEALQ